jgi:hypothetical protein
VGCCGKKREALKTQQVVRVERRVAPLHATPPSPAVETQEPGAERPFHNIGSANLSVRGPITGRLYMFPAGGETVPVDPSDTPYLSGLSRIVPGPRVRPGDKSRRR